jgi:lysophospholipase L1-like esterase
VASNGWAAQLTEYYIRRCDVINRGFSGYTSCYAQLIAPYALGEEDLARAYLVTIWFGANDAILSSSGDPRHVPPTEYKNNLEHIIIDIQERAQRACNPHLRMILITPPPVDEMRRMAFLSSEKGTIVASDRSNQAIQSYVDVCRHLSEQYGISYLDLYDAMKTSVDYSVYLKEDGLHLSSQGNQFVFDRLRELIEQELHHMSPRKLMFVYPDRTTINPNNLSETLMKPILQSSWGEGRWEGEKSCEREILDK